MATDLLNRRVIRVPSVVGRSVTKARILLEDAGFKKIVTLYRESYEDRDTVLDQKPPRTQMVYEDTEVTIWVARRGYLENLPAIYRRSLSSRSLRKRSDVPTVRRINTTRIDRSL